MQGRGARPHRDSIWWCWGGGTRGAGATFISRKKAKVPKMVAEGWLHSCHRRCGSPGTAGGTEAFWASTPQVRLSKSEMRCSFMDSWADGRTDGQTA